MSAANQGLGVASLTQRFGAVTVLDDVAFHVAPGEVVALLGENGAGKTTLLRVVSGFLRPSGGTVTVDGAPVTLRGPRSAAALGVGMVHQHFLLVPELTVAENVVLGREPGAGPLLDMRAAAREVRECAARFGLDVDPVARVGDLGVAQRQRVELLKVLVRGARYLLLDEPTGLLPPDSVRELFTLVQRLAAEGCGVVLVTHRLPEVFAVCDRATVLRRGSVTGDRVVSETTERELARLMVGEDLDSDTSGGERAAAGDALLRINALVVEDHAGRPAVEEVSLDVRAGEIVGIAGVAGSGQVELLEAIAGVRASIQGAISLCGKDIADASPRARRRAGLAYVPGDRGADGLVGALTIAENLEIAAGVAARMFIDPAQLAASAQRVVDAHDVRPPDPDALAGALSGGNQQKVLLARELAAAPRVLIASEPARGLDFRAADAVHRRLRALCDAGSGVLFVGTDLAELLDVCDRVLVLYAGRIAGEVKPGDVDEEALGLMMTGGKR